MAYIYKIINDMNQKIYVGKTEFSIEKRFKEHCADVFKERNEKRPLYSAMRKYGIEHFHIELIEETVIQKKEKSIGLSSITPMVLLVITLHWAAMGKNILTAMKLLKSIKKFKILQKQQK